MSSAVDWVVVTSSLVDAGARGGAEKTWTDGQFEILGVNDTDRQLATWREYAEGDEIPREDAHRFLSIRLSEWVTHEPGSALGPCRDCREGECPNGDHKACASAIESAASSCPWCNELIGSMPYYMRPDNDPEHSDCFLSHLLGETLEAQP